METLTKTKHIVFEKTKNNNYNKHQMVRSYHRAIECWYYLPLSQRIILFDCFENILIWLSQHYSATFVGYRFLLIDISKQLCARIQILLTSTKTNFAIFKFSMNIADFIIHHILQLCLFKFNIWRSKTYCKDLLVIRT